LSNRRLRTIKPLEIEATVLESLSNRGETAIQDRIKKVRDAQVNTRDDPGSNGGMKQFLQMAKSPEAERDHLHHHHGRLEIAATGLQIAMVIASTSVAIHTRWLAFAGAGVGALAIAYAAAILLDIG
jgi:hypothetical protein